MRDLANAQITTWAVGGDAVFDHDLGAFHGLYTQYMGAHRVARCGECTDVATPLVKHEDPTTRSRPEVMELEVHAECVRALEADAPNARAIL